MNKKYGQLFCEKKWVIYSIAFLVGAAMGIISPLATTHMLKHGAGNLWIGTVSSSFFLFLALGSIYAGQKMRGKDISLLIISGLLFTSLCSIVFPLINHPIIWLGLMSMMGIGISFNLVGLQTALHKLTEDRTRAVVSGIYTLCYALGLVVSAVAGPIIYESNEWLPFSLSGICLVLGASLIYTMLKGVLVLPAFSEEKVFRKILVPLYGVFAYGFSETTLVSLYPMFLLHQNIDLHQVGYGLGIFVIGSIIGAVPVTYLADKLGRDKTLAFCLVISIIAILGIILYSSFTIKLIFSFIAGFTIGPVYPLTLALSVQNLSEKELPSGTSLFNVSYGFGSAAGPFLSSLVMGAFGNNYIFSLCLLLFVSLLIRMVAFKKESSKQVVTEDI